MVLANKLGCAQENCGNVINQNRSNKRAFGGLFAVCLLFVLAGCSADKAFTPTVTSAPEQAGGGVKAPTATAPVPAATSTPTDSVIDVSVILTDYRISSFTTAFEVGKTYKFTFSNNGAVVHDFTLEAAGANNQPLTDNGKFASIDLINPGESQTLTWTFTSAGELQIASHLNDDYAKGMLKTGLTAN
jgi:uncharacterized cupredoxin-like copper-binding protein